MVAGLIALGVIAYEFESHYAFIAYALVQISVYVPASNLLASHRFRANYRTPRFRKAFVFGLPLMINGIGLRYRGAG